MKDEISLGEDNGHTPGRIFGTDQGNVVAPLVEKTIGEVGEQGASALIVGRIPKGCPGTPNRQRRNREGITPPFLLQGLPEGEEFRGIQIGSRYRDTPLGQAAHDVPFGYKINKSFVGQRSKVISQKRGSVHTGHQHRLTRSRLG